MESLVKPMDHHYLLLTTRKAFFEGRALRLRSHTGLATIDPDQSYALVEDDDGTNDFV